MQSKFPRENFAWGRVIEDHLFGPYMVREYIDNTSGETLFHGYAHGKDLNEGWNSLDRAIIGAIGKHHDGLNSLASHYFFKMIGI